MREDVSEQQSVYPSSFQGTASVESFTTIMMIRSSLPYPEYRRHSTRLYKYLPYMSHTQHKPRRRRRLTHNTNHDVVDDDDDDDIPYDVAVWNVQHNKARAASRDLDEIIVNEFFVLV